MDILAAGDGAGKVQEAASAARAAVYADRTSRIFSTSAVGR